MSRTKLSDYGMKWKKQSKNGVIIHKLITEDDEVIATIEISEKASKYSIIVDAYNAIGYKHKEEYRDEGLAKMFVANAKSFINEQVILMEEY